MYVHLDAFLCRTFVHACEDYGPMPYIDQYHGMVYSHCSRIVDQHDVLWTASLVSERSDFCLARIHANLAHAHDVPVFWLTVQSIPRRPTFNLK